jgi:hypothetical protein
MKKFACRYALIQLLPYNETGEFANIGVLLVCPQTGHWIYKLETQKHKRYTDFFEGLEHHVYRDAVNVINDELKRLQKLATEATPDQLLNTFNFTVHPREAIIRFSEPRGRLTNNPEKELADLFAHYVEFGFLRNESPEQKLVKRIQDLVKTFELRAPFKEERIGSVDAAFLSLPLVQVIDRQPIKAIKPLYLGQKKINDIYNHGEEWVGKLKRLRKVVGWDGELMITVDGLSDKPDVRKVQQEMISELSQYDAIVENATAAEKLKAFCIH